MREFIFYMGIGAILTIIMFFIRIMLGITPREKQNHSTPILDICAIVLGVMWGFKDDKDK